MSPGVLSLVEDASLATSCRRCAGPLLVVHTTEAMPEGVIAELDLLGL
jgi:hypothetical protein